VEAEPGRVAASQRGIVNPPPPTCTASSGARDGNAVSIASAKRRV
jgi:hypothetical protein